MLLAVVEILTEGKNSMASIASFLVSLKADFGDADSKFDSFVGKMKDVDDQEQETEENLKGLKEGAEEGGDGLEGLGEILSDLTGELIKCAAEAFALTSVFETLKEAVTISANLDSARVAIDTFTGSAEKTSEVMENLAKIANSEALSFKDVVPAAQRMLAMGFSTEQTEKAIKAAGNAAWALREPIQTVTQRMSQMALSGMANQRMLKTLGISSEELARVMGVSVGEVTKAFQSVDKDTALETLTEAMGRFGNQGAKQAEHVKGEWVDLKNAWEEAFDDMGKSLQPFAKSLEGLGATTSVIFKETISVIFKEIVEDMKKMGDEFPILSHLAVTAGQVIADSFTLVTDALSNDKSIDALKIFKESLDKGITYAEASKQAHARANQTVQGVIPENATTGPIGEQPKDLESEYQKGLGPEKAKDAAGIQLTIIAGQQEAVKQSAALARQRAEAEITANHTIIQSSIDSGKDQVTRAQNTAQEEERVAKEKADRIGAINVGEAKALEDLLNKQRTPKIAQTYQGPREDEAKRAGQIKEINIKTDNEIAKSKEDLAAKQEKLQDAVVQASVKGNAQIVKESQKTTDELSNQWFKFFNEITKSSEETTKSFLEATNAGITSQSKILSTQISTGGENKELKLKQQQIALEGEYSSQLSHTDEQHLEYLKKIAALEAAQRQVKLTALAQQLSNLGPGSQDTDETAEKRAQLEAQIQQMSLENQNAQLEAANQYLSVVQEQNHMLQAQKALAGFTTAGSQVDVGSLVGTIVQTFTQLPEKLGSTLSAIIFHHSKDDSAGKQVGQAFRQMGQDVVGKLFSEMMTRLLSEIIIQTGLQAAFNALFPATQTASTVAIVSAIGASTATLVAAITGAGIIDTLAGGGDLEIGRPTIVGEKGRELIIPRGAGTVIPNDKTEDLISSSLLNVSPANSLSAHTNALSTLKAYNSYQGNPSNLKSGGDTSISLHGANFYGVSNTREMMRQIADYSRNHRIGQSYNNG